MMATEKRLIPLSKRIVYAGDVFNSLMAEKKWAATEAADFIKEFRTVDAVIVVRCKDCIYNQNGCCTHSEIYDDTKYRPDYFCADAERRSNETD